nr:MAG: polyprotein [Gallivirus sp.]
MFYSVHSVTNESSLEKMECFKKIFDEVAYESGFSGIDDPAIDEPLANRLGCTVSRQRRLQLARRILFYAPGSGKIQRKTYLHSSLPKPQYDPDAPCPFPYLDPPPTPLPPPEPVDLSDCELDFSGCMLNDDLMHYYQNGSLPFGSALTLEQIQDFYYGNDPTSHGNITYNVTGSNNSFDTSQGLSASGSLAASGGDATAVSTPPVQENTSKPSSSRPSRTAPSVDIDVVSHTRARNHELPPLTDRPSANPASILQSSTQRVRTNAMASDIKAEETGYVTFDTMAYACRSSPWPDPPAYDPPNLGPAIVGGPLADSLQLVANFEWTGAHEPGQVITITGGFPFVQNNSANSTAQVNPPFPLGKDNSAQSGPVISLPSAIVSSNPFCVFSRLYDSNRFYQCGFTVQVSVNANPGMSGILKVTAIPSSASAYDNLNGFSTPAVLLNLSEANTATITLPSFFPRGAGITGVEDSWSLVITSVTQLRLGLMAGALNVNIAVAPRNSRFWLTANPSSQGLVTMPAAGSGSDYSYSAQLKDFHPVTVTPPPLPYLEHLPGEVKSFDEIARIPSFFQRVDIEDNTVGAKVAVIAISGAEILSHTGPLSTAMRAFSQWRGDLIIDLVASVSQNCTGRMMVAYTPPGFEVPDSMNSVSPSAKHLWDITSCSSISILIPNCFPGGWCPSLPHNNPQNYIASLLGFVSIWVENPMLDLPQSAEGWSIVAFIRAGESFELRGCSPQLYLSETQAPASETAAAMAAAVAQPQGDEELRDSDLSTYLAYNILSNTTQTIANTPSSTACYVDLKSNAVNITMLDGETFLYGNRVYASYTHSGIAQSHRGSNQAWSLSSMSWICRNFKAFSCDLAVRISILPQFTGTDNDARPFKLRWSYLPPGAAQCWVSAATAAPYSGFALSDGQSPIHIPLFIPNMLPRNVFQMWPASFPKYNSTGDSSQRAFGVDMDNFGSLQFAIELVNPPASETTENVIRAWMDINIGAINFRGFGFIPQYSPAKTTTLFYPVPRLVNQSRIPAKRQNGVIECDDDSPVYVIRDSKVTYVHWAIRKGDQQISLTKRGIQAVVSYEPVSGDVWATATDQAWVMAKQLIGSPLPYHAFQNCTHFISSITGYNLQNSGFGLALGLGAAAAATASVGVAKTLLDAHFRHLPKRQGPLDKTVEASENIMKAATIVNGAAACLESSVKKIQPSMDKLESAASGIAKSINRVCDIGDKLVPAAKTVIGEAGGIVGKFLMWITKIIGYIMIIFGSPTPLSIAGLITVIAADLAPGLVEIASNTSPIQSLVAWISSKLGIKVKASEIREVFSDDEPEETQTPPPTNPDAEPRVEPSAPPAPEPQGVKDYNDWMNAFKNTDWMIEKVFKLVEKILKWLGVKIRDDPATHLADKEDAIFTLYTDSTAAVSHPSPNLTAIRSNIAAGQKLLQVASQAKSPVHCQMVTQALRNYSSRLTSLTNNTPTPRPEPVVIYLYGPPGSGKSLMATLLASTLANELSGDPDDVFVHPSGGYAYFDGYHGQSVHLIDDIGQDPQGEDWKHFPQMVSTSPFKVPMAALEDKGILYTSRVIICTSNFEKPTRAAVRCAAALDRRLSIILRCEPLANGERLVVEDALAADGPATRHFAADCPFLRFECCRLTIDPKNIGARIEGRFAHLDDLVDEIELLICSKKNNLDCFSHLIKPRKPVAAQLPPMVNGVAPTVPPQLPQLPPGPPPRPQGKLACTFNNPPSDSEDDGYEEIEVLSSTPSEVQVAISQNQDISVIKKLWQWRKPIFVGTAVLSVITSLAVLISLTYSYFKERRQGAYTGTPAVKSKTPEPAPRKNPPRARRQGIVGYNPTIVNNVIGGCSSDGDKLSTFSAIGVGQRFFVTADHVVLKDAAQLTIGQKSYPARKIFTFKELCMLEAPDAPQMKCLDRFIKDCNAKAGYLVASFPRGPGFIQVSDASYVVSDCPEITAAECYHYKCVSFPGLCGAPLVLSTPAGPRLVGVHVAGVAGVTGYADPLVDFMDAFRQANPQSVIVDIPMPGPAPHIPRRSKLTHSPAWGAFEPTKEPAALLNHDRRLPPGVTVDEVAFSKQNKGDVIEPWPGLSEAADLYFSQCNFPRFKTLSMIDAINGVEGLDGIDMTQSAGYPWSLTTSRRELFILNGDGKYVPKPELEEEILKTLRSPDYFYTTFLKDELRLTAKARAGKTRLVEAAPIHAIIAGRMVFGEVFALFHSNPGKFGSAVGCDPDFHWTVFAQSFKKFRNVWSLDYSCFDSTLPSVCFNLIASRLASLIDVDEEIMSPNVVLHYLNTIRSSKHVFGDRAYVMIGGMPSGAVGTSIFNSMINNISVLSALISRPDFVPTPANYQILAYGDDVLYACSPDFHPRDLKAFYDKYTPYVVTPASKEGDFPESSSLADVTFLKRWFVPDETIPFYYHPVIEPDTYEQSVMWSRGGDFQDTVTSLCFLAHHAGPSNYSAWCCAVRDACIRNGYAPPIFLDYSYLQMRWMQVVSG